jgi:hypothetical protein
MQPQLYYVAMRTLTFFAAVAAAVVVASCARSIDEKALADLPAGGYAVLPATMPHFALAKTAVTLQVHGMGPFVVNYVNPSDGPAKK